MFNKYNYYNKLYLLIIFILLFSIDIFSKQYITNSLNNRQIVINNYLSFTLIFNKGIIFGLLSNNVLILYILPIVIISIILFLIIELCFFNTNKILDMSYVLIISGACGNFYDRIKYGAVVDFININILNISLPIFNIADISIFFGVIFTIISNICIKYKNNNKF
ncbi:MAG: signal peptidase II [Candidatus Lightella neohaematopini]|nr:signal peptidase II [Candidatus Lightella neohaematopini]MCV2528757.1 signal peptidase II [Candidatus Lightella neohaematopini]